jgi:hypothetical protein
MHNMSQVVIENTILNSPFREPAKHFRFGDEELSDSWNAKIAIREFLKVGCPVS